MLKRLRKLRSEKGELDSAEYLDRPVLALLYRDCYYPFANADKVADRLISAIDEDTHPAQNRKDERGVTLGQLSEFLRVRTSELDRVFRSIPKRSKEGIQLDELLAYFDKHHVQYDDSQVTLLYRALDRDGDGYVSFDDFRHQLMLVPRRANDPTLFRDAYAFFVDDLEFSSDSDVTLAAESQHGLGYFWAGGIAGVVSRTCTAPFDRIKVYLIAQSAAVPMTTMQAIKAIYARGGLRGFFVGNGLNIMKVLPESAVKFGGFEMAKRCFAHLEGVEDPADISRISTFVAGGLGGMVAQLCVYPIDTLKFRVQCAKPIGPGRSVLASTLHEMWAANGLHTFYRGITVGVLGIFPFAALDLGIFSVLKSTYIKRQSHSAHIDPSDVQMSNMAVLTMGAISGSIGASAVYPINLVRTRIQTQGTPAHPYIYKGFGDCCTQTFRRDGWRGFFRGLGPNLAKVAPSVSISYLVYENAKHFLGLD